MLIDTHAHLYAKQFDQDRDATIQRAIELGIERFYLPNIDLESIEGMLQLEKDYPNHCFPMMGLHPCSVKADYKEKLKVIEQWLEKREFCAVGEIGIDLYWDKTFFEEQKEAFKIQIDWAKNLEIPIVIHARESLEPILEIVEANYDERLTGVFHCFSGTPAQVKRVQALGFYMGIGGVLTFKKSGLDQLVEAHIPLQSIVLETDAPYLAPTPYRGKRNESAYVDLVARKLAEVKKVNLEEIVSVTSQNALKLFKHSI